MPDDHPLADRGRAIEDEYFRKRDRELIERMRRAATADDARQQLSTQSGLSDPALLDELQALGFTPDTVALLPFVPLIQVAWAEGNVSDAERRLITQLSRSRGIAEGSAADRQLAAWLTSRPSEDVFSRASRLIGAVLTAPGDQKATMTAQELVEYCDEIAAASGGIFGINRISAEERDTLAAIAAQLNHPSRRGSTPP